MGWQGYDNEGCMPNDRERLRRAVREINDLPDISGDDSDELKRLCDQSTREVQLTGAVSASTSLEMIAHMRELEMKLRVLQSQLNSKPQRRSKKPKIEDQLRDSDVMAQMIGGRDDVVYGPHDALPQGGDHVARIGKHVARRK